MIGFVAENILKDIGPILLCYELYQEPMIDLVVII